MHWLLHLGCTWCMHRLLHRLLTVGWCHGVGREIGPETPDEPGALQDVDGLQQLDYAIEGRQRLLHHCATSTRRRSRYSRRSASVNNSLRPSRVWPIARRRARARMVLCPLRVSSAASFSVK